jgi:mitochondrial fission protein ELM1
MLEHFPALGETGWTLLLGGDGEGLQWSEEDFIGLTERFLEAAGTAGEKVFVATSRRTPERVENAVRQRCEAYSGFITGAWFHASGGKTLPLLALLGASNRTFVTADSVSMTNEAVASGVPAVAIYPTEGMPNPRHEMQFSRLEREGRLARVHLTGADFLGEVQPACGWQLLTGDPQAELADLALRRLGLRPGI